MSEKSYNYLKKNIFYVYICEKVLKNYLYGLETSRCLLNVLPGYIKTENISGEIPEKFQL